MQPEATQGSRINLVHLSILEHMQVHYETELHLVMASRVFGKAGVPQAVLFRREFELLWLTQATPPLSVEAIVGHEIYEVFLEKVQPLVI